MPPSQARLAAGISSTSRQIGTTLGVAIASATLGATATSAPFTALAAATHGGWWLNTIYGLAPVAIGDTMTTKWAASTTFKATIDQESVLTPA